MPARITLGTSTVLTVIFQSFYGGLLHPQAPYLKAVDVWMATALTFVLCSLIEFAIVNKMLRSEQKQLASKRLLQLTMPNLSAQCDDRRRDTLQQRQEVLHHLAAYVKELYLHNQVSKAGPPKEITNLDSEESSGVVRKLKNLMYEKKSNLCVAADGFDSAEDLLKFAEKVGSHIIPNL